MNPFHLTNYQTKEILHFWFDTFKNNWFGCLTDDDLIISELFLKYDTYLKSTIQSETIGIEITDDPQEAVNSILAFILIYDQFYRHHRRRASIAISEDPYNQTTVFWSRRLINCELLSALRPEQQCFALLPLRHSKDLDNIILAYKEIKKQPGHGNLIVHKFLNAAKKDYETALYKEGFLINGGVMPHGPLNNALLNGEKHVIDFDHYSPLTRLMIKIGLIVPDIWSSYINIDSNEPLYKTVLEYVKALQRDHKINDQVIISLSGGVDSLLLTYIMLQIKKREGLIKNVIAIHIYYGNRDKSHLEAEFVQKWCNFHGVTLYIRTINEIKRGHSSTDQMDSKGIIDRALYEKYTRDIRFDLYKRVSEGHIPVLLGHNRDDCFENIFTNIAKRQHYSNLKTMKSYQIDLFNVPIGRPFLNTNKADIVKLAQKIDLYHTRNSTPPWATRYKIRNHVMYNLSQQFPEFLLGMESLTDHLQDVHTSRQQSINKIINGADQLENKVVLPLPDAIDLEMFKQLLITIAHQSGVEVPSHKSMQSAHLLLQKRYNRRPPKITLSPFIYLTYESQFILTVII